MMSSSLNKTVQVVVVVAVKIVCFSLLVFVMCVWVFAGILYHSMYFNKHTH